MNIFKVAEVVDLGIEKEKKRRDFYAHVAEKIDDSELKKLFANLRDWEEKHVERFSEIRKSVDEAETVESYPGELEEYMKVFVDDKLYHDISSETFLKKITSPVDAIDYAKGFEKDAILFFNALLSYVISAHQESIRELIEEEKKHLVALHQLRRKLTA